MGIKKLILFGLILLLLAGCTAQHGKSPDAGADIEAELLVSAAASLANSLEEIGALFEHNYSDINVTYNFGSSGVLQHQIEQGAPVDIFLSAGKKQMTHLIDAGLIDKGDSMTLLGNELVIVVQEGERDSWNDLSPLVSSPIKTIAIGEPDTAPAGEYAREALIAGDVWDRVSNKVVYAKDVRQVLSYVETGNADAGFVYKSDALTSKKVKVAMIVDAKFHQPIEYPLGVVKSTRFPQAAQAFYDFLHSPESLEVFQKHGFSAHYQNIKYFRANE
jgi:molybdate transport system substrate-binding protein